MLIVASLLFSVLPLSIPQGRSLEIGSQATQSRLPELLASPPTIRITHNDIEAVVVLNGDVSPGNSDGEDILVFKSGKLTAVLPRPSDKELVRSSAFPAAQLGENGRKIYPDAKISNIAISENGHIYVSIEHEVQGAYLATERWSFIYTSSGWNNALAELHSGYQNFTIPVVENAHNFAYMMDYDGDPQVSSDAQLGNFDEDDVSCILNRVTHHIGSGEVTGMRNGFIVGYDMHYRPSGYAAGTILPTEAYSWHNKIRMALGHGIAWGLNHSGWIVGDNRSTFNSSGQPIVWHDGHISKLSNSNGSAYSISDNGMVVGDLVSGYGFIAQAYSNNHKLLKIDNILAPGNRGWHIQHAYGIADDGDILAMGSRKNGQDTLVLLRPVR